MSPEFCINVFRWAGCSIWLTFSICCWRYQVAALTSEDCYCGNWQHGLAAIECFNTSSSGGTKDVRGERERQRWDRLLPFPFSLSLETVLVTDPQVAEGTNLCVAKLYVNLFSSFPVSPACLLGVDREVWPSTQLKDHFCTAFVCLPLQAECRLGRLLLWKFQETWLDAPTSPQVSCYCILHRCRSWKDYSSNCVINAFWLGIKVCFY